MVLGAGGARDRRESLHEKSEQQKSKKASTKKELTALAKKHREEVLKLQEEIRTLKATWTDPDKVHRVVRQPHHARQLLGTVHRSHDGEFLPEGREAAGGFDDRGPPDDFDDRHDHRIARHAVVAAG